MLLQTATPANKYRTGVSAPAAGAFPSGTAQLPAGPANKRARQLPQLLRSPPARPASRPACQLLLISRQTAAERGRLPEPQQPACLSGAAEQAPQEPGGSACGRGARLRRARGHQRRPEAELQGGESRDRRRLQLERALQRGLRLQAAQLRSSRAERAAVVAGRSPVFSWMEELSLVHACGC